jgi:hypothetical protein
MGAACPTRRRFPDPFAATGSGATVGVADHSRMSRSALALANILPVGCTTTDVIASVCPSYLSSRSGSHRVRHRDTFTDTAQDGIDAGV